MPGPFRVVCVGVLTLDALALVPRYPAADERLVGEQVVVSCGGPAANAAIVLARQGVSVAFIGRVGRDAAGDQAARLLADEGVDVSALLRDPAMPTQSSCVVVAREAQTRAISTLAVPALPLLPAFGPLAAQLIAEAEWAHADHLGFLPVSEYLRGLGAARRARFSLDAGNPVAGFTPRGLDLYVPTAQALLRQFADPAAPDDVAAAARRAMAEGAGAVVATDGAAGSMAWWHESFMPGPTAGHASAPARKDVAIVSTLGAGDVFHGAMLAALCRGCGWAEALWQANVTAALSCRALDGHSAVPTLAELQTALT
jgi:sugar/nucleoside kinase (ribokinase family)